MENDMTAELTWGHATHEISDAGLSAERVATQEELERIARALELLSCPSLTAQYTITPLGQDRYQLTGRLTAQVSQACVVTLEPITSDIDEELAVVFWPEEQIPAPAANEIDLGDEAEPEPIIGGYIDIGRVVFESLASAIDPYPRKPGATLDRDAAAPQGQQGQDGPFAALAKIKQ